jgi:hypothetical protein
MLDSTGLRPVMLAGDGSAPCDVVFCSTIAKALVNVLRRLDAPGTYSVLESPEWSLRQMYEFFSSEAGRELKLIGGSNGGAAGPGVGWKLVSTAIAALSKNKDFVTAHLLPSWPDLEQRIRGRYLARRAAADIAAGRARLISTPHHFRGPVPGKRLRSLVEAGTATPEEALRVRELLDRILGPASHNFKLSDSSVKDAVPHTRKPGLD